MSTSKKMELIAFVIVAASALGTSVSAQRQPQSAMQMVKTMIAREQEASGDRNRYFYISEERSDRTRGHLWTERMAETDWGTVRYLVAEDGKSLPADRVTTEKAKLADEATRPEDFRRNELKEDESRHSQKMLALLARAFVFDVPDTASEQEIRIGYKPDPQFTPQTVEERVLHSMAGVVVLDAKTMRLRSLQGRAPQDVSLGFGPLATLRAGSAFLTTREPLQTTDWKTARVQTSIQGKALFLKAIARQQDYRHSGFTRIGDSLTVSEAVELVEH